MEKKKLKLSISGSSKKTINSIEQAKSQSKNTVVIEKKPRFGTKPNYSRPNTSNERPKGSAPFVPRNNTFSNQLLPLVQILKDESLQSKEQRED